MTTLRIKPNQNDIKRKLKRNWAIQSSVIRVLAVNQEGSL
jgi:hypothetical protein